MNKSKFAKFRKGAIAALCAVAVTCTGLAAACSDTNPSDDDNTASTPRKEDTQLLRNGNFEYSEVPEKGVYLIKNTNNWSRSGDSSGAMSGIINTSGSAWEKITDYDLKDKLDANNDLKVGDSDYEDKYVDYNGMDSGDIFYVDPYVAALSESNIGDEDGHAKDSLIRAGGKQRQRSYMEFLGIEKVGDGDSAKYYFRGQENGVEVFLNTDDGDYYFDTDFEHSVRYAIIDNPETHLGSYRESDGKHYLGNTEILVDENGNYYIDSNGNGEVDILEDESAGNVLMIHNYPTNSNDNGISQYYSSQSITLEANTSAEISVWVKTSDLKFDKGYLLHGDPVIGMDEQDKGAYIEVAQSVASTTIDTFKIKAINTQKILADNPDLDTNNGWLQYTVYVNACNFADTTVTIKLGLGDNETHEKLTGYAFFDDVEVKKFINFDDKDENGNALSSYSENESKLKIGEVDASYCSLRSEAEEKIFYADKQTRGGNDERFSTRFHYLIDLASEKYTEESFIAFNDADLTVSASLTTYKDGDKLYASALNNNANVASGITKISEEYKLPDSLKDEGGRPTFNDLIAIYDSTKTNFTSDDFNPANFNTDDSGRGLAFEDLSKRLDGALAGDNGLKTLEKFCNIDNGSMLVMLSRYGAAYTSTLESSTLFTVADNTSDTNYKIISFWVKTSDMQGSTAATIKIVDVADDDNTATITVDTTNVKTNVGDNENIYNGWVQCFFFVKNDTDAETTFKIEFSFGNTSIDSAAATSYNYGWAAMANIQTLDVTEDVFKIVSEGAYSKILTFSEDNAKSHTPFDEATRMSNTKKEIGTPSSYYGVNGGSIDVVDKEFGDAFDKRNNKNNAITGLISRDAFDYETEDASVLALRSTVLGSFVKGAENWNEVFGEQCYQPLIIVDSLRTYYDRVTGSEDYIKEHISEYFIKDEDGNYVSAEGTEYDKKTTYYSAPKLAKNYGYIGESQTVAASSSVTVSVKVMVTGGATAWVYLVDPDKYDVMSLETPKYTYYYDDDGNVLREEFDKEWSDTEHRNAIIFKLRSDGLYDGEDGGVYANLSNLVKKFKYRKFERNVFYSDANGKNPVSYDHLEDGVTYYNADGTVANHYLVVGAQTVYEYADGHYYYLVNGERSIEVKDFKDAKDFDSSYLRYDASARVASDYEYAVKVGNTGVDENGKPNWVTVNFIINAGNEEKNYRFELWSGKRDETGENDSEDTYGAVAFDYCNSGISSNNYSSVLADYESRIKNIYIKLIAGKDESVLSTKNLSELNLNELKSLVAELGIEENTVTEAFKAANLDENYSADYYTFSWYDSAQYIPFNRETAEAGQTGYSYTASSNSESLIYFSTRDYSDNSYNVFVDYSSIDQTITLNTNNTDDDTTTDDTTTGNDGQSPWLLITSIVLVVVLLFVLVAILVRYLWKDISKKRGQKQIKKNNYKQRERYMRKLGLVKTAPVEEEVETPVEEPVAPSTEEAPTEETTVEELPEEEIPAEDTPAEDDKKDE